jgi:hypothetical protein
VSATRSAKYSSEQAEKLARGMFRRQREVEALEELDEALTPLRDAVDGQMTAWKYSPHQMASNFAQHLQTPFQVFTRAVDALGVRCPQGVRTALVDFTPDADWPQRIQLAQAERVAKQDDVAIQAARRMTGEPQEHILELRGKILAALEE